MALFYTDEDFPYPVVEGLRRLGHDVVTMRERGVAGRGLPDPDVLRLAIAEGRAVLTRNRRHFIRLHQGNPSHAGIVVCTMHDDFTAMAARIDEAISLLPTLNGQLVRVNRPSRPVS